MNLPFAITADLDAELRRYLSPAPDDEFHQCKLARHYQVSPQFAADRLKLIAPQCLTAGIDLGPAIETLESRTEATIGRIQVCMLLTGAIEAAEGLQRFAAYLLVPGKSFDDIARDLETGDLLGLLIIHLQMAVAQVAAREATRVAWVANQAALHAADKKAGR